MTFVVKYLQIQDITDMQAGFKFTTQDKESVVAICIPKGQVTCFLSFGRNSSVG